MTIGPITCLSNWLLFRNNILIKKFYGCKLINYFRNRKGRVCSEPIHGGASCSSGGWYIKRGKFLLSGPLIKGRSREDPIKHPLSGVEMLSKQVLRKRASD